MLPGRAFVATFTLLCVGISCSNNEPADVADHDENQAGAGSAGAPPVDDEPWQGEPAGECDAVLRHFTDPSATHVTECSDSEYPMSPPVFGNHYPTWPAYQTYDYPVPLGYLVHGLEHGAVVLFYDCPEGCAEEVSEAQAFIDDLPLDPRCSDAVKHQVILVPRPGLGARWAASAWGYSLSASCFDPRYFGQFYEEHHGQGPEDLCNQGLVIAQDACP